MSQLLRIAGMCAVFLLFAAKVMADDPNQPRKTYASIDTSRELIEAFQSPTTTASNRKKMSEKIALEPGSYNPILLLLAGLEYIKAKEYDRAALL